MLQLYKKLKTFYNKLYAYTYMFVVICSIKIAIKIFPFRTFKSVYSSFIKLIPVLSKRDNKKTQIMVMAIQRLQANLPFQVLCLIQALALKFYLRKENDYLLKVGVKKDERNKFAAHAWIEHNGTTIIGDMPDFNFRELWLWKTD
ncbi:MAG: lasso peptide biosynthesis B2 protein [Bacteroidetes bacterium]|nr:lasso peptide biosynthesis B2 protein [Bacteroidota bacterium]